MSMNYEELDETTRDIMLSEFESEEAGGTPYRSKALSDRGLKVFPQLMRDAIRNGTESTLANSLNDASLWEPMETYVRDGVSRQRKRNVRQASERLATTEFSTWYVRGLARRLLDEGVTSCRVYRGAQPKWEPGECAEHEGRIVDVKTIYDNHRVRYWPEPGDKEAFSIPFGPGCHHVIKRA
ncbi:MAG: hypothetical protein HWN69_00945 [Desulfobacterales bacterium]|nr:hypothetical protein [Desulfobacterales bacterium]